MPVIVGVALGGAFGASGRYVLDHLIEQHTVSVFPWATFTINATGCFRDRHDHRDSRSIAITFRRGCVSGSSWACSAATRRSRRSRRRA